MSARIFNALIKELSYVGACAMMGNMQAESALRANNAQDGMTKLSDADYTSQVDNGIYTGFVHDAVGYGLCQWTYWSRKSALLAFARDKGVSVGDEAMQTEFCLKELRVSYPSLYAYLKTTTDIEEATKRICAEYERPAYNNFDARIKFARDIYNSFVEPTGSPTEGAQEKVSVYTAELSNLCRGFRGGQVKAMQSLLNRHYAIYLDVDGIFGEATEKALKEYQQSRGLDADGICGADTWGKLLA